MTQLLATRLGLAIQLSTLEKRQIAKKSGYSREYTTAIVRGARRNPTLNYVQAMAQTLGVDPAWLAGWDKPHE